MTGRQELVPPGVVVPIVPLPFGLLQEQTAAGSHIEAIIFGTRLASGRRLVVGTVPARAPGVGRALEIASLLVDEGDTVPARVVRQHQFEDIVRVPQEEIVGTAPGRLDLRQGRAASVGEWLVIGVYAALALGCRV